MDDDVTGSSDNHSADTDTDTHSVELVDELLIEEISIDGMCGVY